MFKLAIDTSTSKTYVALKHQGGEIFENEIASLASHNESMASLVQDLLRKNNTDIKELKGLVIGSGPGSFTGLRIGYSFMKGLAYSLNMPIMQIPSLAAIANSFKNNFAVIAALASSGQGKFFYQVFENIQGNLKTISEPLNEAPESIINFLLNLKKNELQNGREIGLVFADQEDSDNFQNTSMPNLLKKNIAEKLASSLLELAEEEFLQKSNMMDLLELSRVSPVYIREVAAKSLADRGILKPFSY